MPDGGHIDLNSVQCCSDSLKEELKQTMLTQEVEFIGQVFELHRLYKIQTEMTGDFTQRALNNYKTHVDGVNSNPVDQDTMSEVRSGDPGFRQKPVILQLSADEFIGRSANELSGNGEFRGFPIESKNPFQEKVTLDLNRPLSIGEDRSWIGKRTSGPPPVIIDLEDPNSSFSNDVHPMLPSDLTIPKSCLKEKDKLERSILVAKHDLQSFPKSRTGHVFPGSKSSRPFDGIALTSKRQTSCEAGVGSDFVAADASVPCGMFKFDLNTIPLEDLSDISDTHFGMVNPVVTSFSTMTDKVYPQSIPVSSSNPTSWRESNVNEKLKETQNSVYTSAGKLTIDGKPECNDGKIIFIDLGSDSDSDDVHCISGDPKIESVGSTSKLPNDLLCKTDPSPETPDSNICFSDSEVAEILVQLSQDRQAKEPVDLEKLISKLKVSESKGDGPQRSVDSYEAMVLNAKELGPEDYCVSSNAIVLDEPKKDSRYKLKRGTRMKNFQKDILPSISTLSRQEIRQDMIIFESVLKSRECKKMKGKAGDGDNWSMPPRGKRSRIGRRSSLP